MNKTGVILAGAAVFVVCRLFAETQIPLWPDGAMPVGANKGVVVGEETISEKGIVQNVSVPAIEVFLPTNTTRSAMGVVICFGTIFTLPLTVTILPVVYWKVHGKGEK